MEIEHQRPGHSADRLTIAASPNNPPWNSLVAMGVWIASVLAIVIFPAIFLIPFMLSAEIEPGSNADLAAALMKDPTAILLQIIAVLPAHAATLLIAWFIVTKNRTFSFRETLGWNAGGFKWWHYLAILSAFFAIAIVVGNFYPEEDNDLLRILRSSRAAVYLVAFMATFTAPLVEEVVYRGILYSAFQRTFGVVTAVVAVTFLFAVVHVPQYYPSFSTIFLLTLLSLTLTVIRVKTDNLLPCIILHTIFNGIQSLLLIFEPYIQAPALQPEAIPGMILFLH